MATLLHDLRFGIRMLARNPGFTAVAVITLALGIGANSTIFSLVSAILLQKPAVRDPDRVMMVQSTNRARGWDLQPVSAPDFLDWRSQSHSFEGMAAADGENAFSLTGSGNPERVTGTRVSANYFQVLGVSAALGRAFVQGEDQAGREHVIILSNRLWKSHFASDPSVIGKTVNLNGEPTTIIGVMPAWFSQTSFPSQIWIPLVFDAKQLSETGRDSRFLYVCARLKPRVTIEQAQAEMAGIARRTERSHPKTDRGWGAHVLSLQEFEIEYTNTRQGIRFLMATVVFVLLIACANIAGLRSSFGTLRSAKLIHNLIGGGAEFEYAVILIKSVVRLAFLGHHQASALFAHVQNLALAQAKAHAQGLRNGNLAFFGDNRFHTQMVWIPTSFVKRATGTRSALRSGARRRAKLMPES
jgi:putative ABC transport system permease protein